jgi:hypothetical protein
VRVGYIPGQGFIVNPTAAQMCASKLDLMMAGTADAVLMIEGFCDWLTEEQMIEVGVVWGRGQGQCLCGEGVGGGGVGEGGGQGGVCVGRGWGLGVVVKPGEKGSVCVGRALGVGLGSVVDGSKKRVAGGARQGVQHDALSLLSWPLLVCILFKGEKTDVCSCTC